MQALLDQLRQRGPLQRVLILPPDLTRLHSWAGFLTCVLYEQLHRHADIAILPAVGTHMPMTDDELRAHVPRHAALASSTPTTGETASSRIGEVPGAAGARALRGTARFLHPRRTGSAASSTSPWDAIISVGQLVPHEVIGIANHSKNVFVGVGGSDLINKSHWLGAVHGIERIMGRARHAGPGGARLCQRTSRPASADRVSVDGARPG